MTELSGIPTEPDAPEIVRRSSKELVRPGQIIASRYEVSSRLGAGGMGAVFRVHDRVLDEDVALKVILPAAVGDARALERMRSEVKIARKITHPNVCRVFDLGEDAGVVFLTMELVEGRTLRQALAGGVFEPNRAMIWFEQIVAGVAAAHEQGVVHRDLKPENILLRNDERCLVADFGLARGVDGDAKTQGEKAGTLAYMSPEQRRGELLDVRSDVYALGLIGRELLGEASGGVGEVVAKALAERPEERFATAGEMGAALKKVGESALKKVPGTFGEEAGSPPEKVAPPEKVPGTFKKKVPTTFLAVTFIIATAALIFFARAYLHRDQSTAPSPSASSTALPPDPARVFITVLPFENLTGNADWIGLSQSAPESVRAALRTIPEVTIVQRDAGAAFSVRGNVQQMGDHLRLFAQMEPVVDVGDVFPSEPVDVDVTGDVAPALDILRMKLLDEARIALGRYRRWQRATLGTTNATAREKLQAYYRLIGPAPRSEHYEPGLRLLDEAIVADADYVPARVERVFLWMLGATAGSKLQRYERALEELNAILQKHPGDVETLVMRCRVAQGLVERAEHPNDALIDRAMAACADALTAAPSSAHVHITLGRIHDRRCEDAQAIRALSRAVELDRSLSGRALTKLLPIAQTDGQLLIADRASADLLAFQQEEEKLGVRASSRRAGAPETRGAYLARGGVLLALERIAEARDAFSRELARMAESPGDPVEEATAIRGLLRVATVDKKDVPRVLVDRLQVIEQSYRERLQTKPEDVQILARTYQFVDAEAAANWIEPLGRPQHCEDAIQRALIYRFAGRTERVKAMLAACSPTEQWEKQCMKQLFQGMTKP